MMCLHVVSHSLQARILLSRPSHKTEGYTVRGKAARAYLPHYPLPRDETWWFFLVDAANNAVLAFNKVRCSVQLRPTSINLVVATLCECLVVMGLCTLRVSLKLCEGPCTNRIGVQGDVLPRHA